jgi:dolichol kinase
MVDTLREETKRKVGRILLGTILILSAVYIKNTSGIIILRNTVFFFTLIALLLDFLRVEFRVPFPFLQDQFLLRPCEKTGLHGTTTALIACVIALAFFDFDIAMAAIAISIYGDSLAAIFGTLSGTGGFRVYRNKTVAGSLTMIIISAIVAYFFLQNIFIIIPMAILATLLEMVTEHLQDDIMICVFTPFVGQLVAKLLGLRPFPAGFQVSLIVALFIITFFSAFYLFSLPFRKKNNRKK